MCRGLIFGQKVGQIKLKIGQIREYFRFLRAKYTETDIKRPGFVPFGVNLDHFGAKSFTIQVKKEFRMEYIYNFSFFVFSSKTVMLEIFYMLWEYFKIKEGENDTIFKV